MAEEGLVPTRGTEVEAKITPIVITSCIMVATGGLVFGYDVGVSGYTLAYSNKTNHVFFKFDEYLCMQF